MALFKKIASAAISKNKVISFKKIVIKISAEKSSGKMTKKNSLMF